MKRKACEEEKEMRRSYTAVETKRKQEVSREKDNEWGKKARKIEITQLRQKMERMEGEKLLAHPPLQKRKWSVQKRQNSKPLPNTPPHFCLMCVQRRSASFVLPRDKGVLHVTKESDWGSTKGMRDGTVSDGET